MTARLRANIVLALAGVLCAIAIRVHVPGHVSMDSSMQLYEAATGESVTWFPPFMSALLRWMGGGLHATSLFVALVSVLTYGAMALVARVGTALPAAVADTRPRAGLRLLVACALVLNPLIFLYVGIVWKDVLFAALLAASIALSLRAAYLPTRGAVPMWLLAALLLLPAPMVRQHGIFLAPWLALAPFLGIAHAVRARSRWQRLAIVALLFVVFALASLALRHVVDATIHDAGDKSTAVGFRGVESYDITGMIAARDGAQGLPAELANPAFIAAVRQWYSDDRIDTVMARPEVLATMGPLPSERIQAIWLRMIATHPGDYAWMKLRQFGWLLDLQQLHRCLPVHVGIDGNRDYLAALHIPVRLDARDHHLYVLSTALEAWPVHRHWAYLVLLAFLSLRLWRSRRRRAAAANRSVLVVASSTWLLYLSFIPTGMACDFRYLYPALCMVSLLAIHALCEPLRARGDAGSPEAAEGGR
jgi:hypothetical protein